MNDHPLIKFILYFICGIILQKIFGLNGLSLLTALILLLSSLIPLIQLNKNYLKPLTNFVVLLLIILSAMLHYSQFKNQKANYPFDSQKVSNAVVYGKVNNIELIKEERIVFNVKTDSLFVDDKMVPMKISLIASLREAISDVNRKYKEIGVGNYVECRGNIFRARNERNPGEFDYEDYIQQRGFSGLLIINEADNVKIIDKNIEPFGNAVFNVRKAIDEQILSMHNKTTGGFLRGLLLGDRSMIQYEIENEFVNAGVVHVLSVSGLHVGFIILIFIFLFKRFNVYTRFALTFIGLLFYVIITYFQAPVTRSAVMGLALLSAPLTNRSRNNINSLSLAALIILIFRPDDLFDPGFQLSFSAILAIIIFYPPFSKFIYKLNIKFELLKDILLFCAVSLAAQIGTLPFTLVYFHKLSIVALFANMFVIPLSGMIVGLGIFTIAIGPIINWFGSVFASANELMTYVLFYLVELFGKLNFSFIPINQFSLYDGLIFYFVLIFLYHNWKKLTTAKAKIITVVFSILALGVFFPLDNRDLLEDKKLSIAAIDIGQGDSFLIRFPNGETALIDGGDATKYFDNGERVIKPFLDRMGIDEINYGFISHVDGDHYRGMVYFITSGLVKVIYKPKIDSALEKDIELEKLIRSKGIPVRYYGKDILKIGGTRLYILNDTLNNYFESFETNDKSGVIKLVYGTTSFLFCGDAQTKAEKYYAGNYKEFLRCSVLKAGHHGSKTSTSEIFLNYVKPKFAIISSGILNRFNHPSPEIIERLQNHNVQLLRTDLSGAVILQSDGKTIRNINWKKPGRGFIF
ncbi:MAG: DNA internalization-related competence protein ComEC/Rec2 [Bacteroidota bacterium]